MCRCMVTNHPRMKIFHVAGEEGTEDLSISTDSLVVLLSIKSGNENVSQINIYRAEERGEGVNPDHQNEDVITPSAGYRVVGSHL
ncbi:hypothetical protein NPIL_110151 [Nephila pilipes]|uniref:Uncharacterized protein n=1 Tax=Nephila pilipes TaxID=299642 RepID=A0A8X6MEW7_NEPPI|nr:hypothetical protein NPIL_110151 [Nephila pilipes]